VGVSSWRPVCGIDLVFCELMYCAPDVPSDILKILHQGLATFRPTGNLVRYARKLRSSDRFKMREPEYGAAADISGCAHSVSLFSLPLAYFYQTQGHVHGISSLAGVHKRHLDLRRSTVVYMVSFPFEFVRLTEGWPSCFESVGHSLEDVILHYDIGLNGEYYLLLPPLSDYLNPWITFYDTRGTFYSYGLKSSTPLNPRTCNGLSGDIMRCPSLCELDDEVVSLVSHAHRLVPKSLIGKGSHVSYHYDPVQIRFIVDDWVT